MNRCAANDYEAARKSMLAWYDKLFASLSTGAEKQQLEAAQRAWVAFRDAECALEALQYEGGSIQPLIHANCMATLTRQREVDLRDMADQEAPMTYSWGPDMSRLLQLAGEQVSDAVFWNPYSMSFADLDGDGDFDVSLLGILPGGVVEPEATVVLLVGITGTDRVLRVDLPVGDGGLCSMEVELREEISEEGGLPMLVVDDHACDAFRFLLKPGGEELELLRN